MNSEHNKSIETCLLTPTQVARRLRVSPVTVRHWALNGRLNFVTTPGGHRRFQAEEIERFAHEHGVIPANSATAGLRVLIVDDDRQLSRMLTDFVANFDESSLIAVAHDGFEAGNLLSEFTPSLILLDLMMPGLDGFSVCARIKRNPKTQHIPVIAMTGQPTAENITAIVAAGAEQCLSKPLNLETLRSLLKQAKSLTAAL